MDFASDRWHPLLAHGAPVEPGAGSAQPRPFYSRSTNSTPQPQCAGSQSSGVIACRAPTPVADSGLRSAAVAESSGSSGRWRPTKAHAPSKILDARGAADNFYAQGLSWGADRMAAIIGTSVLLFDPLDPQSSLLRFNATGIAAPSTCLAHRCGGSDDYGVLPPSSPHAAPLTAIQMCAHSDDELVVADAAGNCALLTVLEAQQGVGPTRLSPATPPAGGHGSVVVKRRFDTAGAGGAAIPDLSRIAALDTTPSHPFLVAVGNGLGTLRLFDLRSGGGPVLHCCGLDTVNAAGGSGVVDGATIGDFSPHCPVEVAALAGVSGIDEVCAVRFSPSGSMLAAGTNEGVVSVWSLAKPSAPLLSVAGAHQSAVKALAWNPAARSTLASGGGALDGSVMMTNVADGRSSPVAYTSAQITQIGFAPDGAHLVTTHGLSRSQLGVPPNVPFHKLRARSRGTPDGALYGFGDALNSRQTTPTETPDVGEANVTARRAVRCATHGAPTEVHVSRNSVCVWSIQSLSSSSGSPSLKLVTALKGHSARPLHLAAQRSGGGVFATMAAGPDDTIRFWPLFEVVASTAGCSNPNGAVGEALVSSRSATPTTDDGGSASTSRPGSRGAGAALQASGRLAGERRVAAVSAAAARWRVDDEPTVVLDHSYLCGASDLR